MSPSAFAQGAADREHVQPVEIFAELAGLDGLHRVHVGRRDHPHVHRLLLAAAQPPERALLQHAQQLDLGGRHHLGNLVEEQRAAMRELEHAGPAIVRAGEGALLMSEDLALQQRLGNRRTVDRDERERRPRELGLVNRLGDEFVPDSPEMSTDAMVGAACSMTRYTDRMVGLLPTMRPKVPASRS